MGDLLPPPPLAIEPLQSLPSPEKEKELECTVCGEGLGKKGHSKKRRVHPRLKLPVCVDCLAIYESGEFIVDGGHEIYCRWCGDGGDLVACDSCITSFCALCIERNFGKLELERIQALPAWSCFFCAPWTLEPVRAKCQLKPEAARKRGAADATPAAQAVGGSAAAGGGLPSRAGEVASSLLPASKLARLGSPSGGASAHKPAALPELPEPGGWVVSEDIALGRERHLKIRCVNEVDREPLPPFTYTAANVPSQSVLNKVLTIPRKLDLA